MAQFTCGPLEFRSNYLLKKGEVTKGHSHNFDHPMLCMDGRLSVKLTLPNGKEVVKLITKGVPFNVAAGIEHEITSLQDGSWYLCIFPHRNPDGSFADRNIGNDKAYA